MKVRVLHSQSFALVFSPHHEGVHGSADAGLGGFIRRCSVARAAVGCVSIRGCALEALRPWRIRANQGSHVRTPLSLSLTLPNLKTLPALISLKLSLKLSVACAHVRFHLILLAGGKSPNKTWLCACACVCVTLRCIYLSFPVLNDDLLCVCLSVWVRTVCSVDSSSKAVIHSFPVHGEALYIWAAGSSTGPAGHAAPPWLQLETCGKKNRMEETTSTPFAPIWASACVVMCCERLLWLLRCNEKHNVLFAVTVDNTYSFVNNWIMINNLNMCYTINVFYH